MKISIALIALNIATVFMVLAAPGIMRDPELVLIKSKLDGLVREQAITINANQLDQLPALSNKANFNGMDALALYLLGNTGGDSRAAVAMTMMFLSTIIIVVLDYSLWKKRKSVQQSVGYGPQVKPVATP